MTGTKPTAIAIGAHPDDIEFYMAGTLLLLKKAGYEIHCFNIANGNCGSVEHSSGAAKSIREAEARHSAKIMEAEFHKSLCNDLEILYSVELLRGVSAVIRAVQPSIVLTHPPQDYMEDHMNACRLAVSAAFVRGMPNFRTSPSRDPGAYDVTVYHAMPHGLRDGLRRRVQPGLFVNTEAVHRIKREALAAHQSQHHWLETSQGMNSYLLAMEEISLEVGRMSRKFQHAEGWRRHLHLGFSGKEIDPLANALRKKCLVNDAYETGLET